MLMVVTALLADALAACASSAPAAVEPPGPVNLDFEHGVPGHAPDGWLVPGFPKEYKVETRIDSSRGGSRCLVISRASRRSSDFATAVQRFDARPWRGRRVEFSAFLCYRGEQGAGAGALWVRVDGANGRVLSYDNMGDRPVTSSQWAPARIAAEVPGEAESLSIGFMLGGSGALWANDARFRLLGALGEGDVPPRPLTARELENLVAFARLLGYVRHFDPADSAATTDWNAFAIAAVDTVEGARGPAELAAILRQLFQPLDPALRVDSRPAAIDSSAFRPPGAVPTGILAWTHHGWGSSSAPGGSYWSRREGHGLDRAELRPGPARTITESLGGGVWCAVPMSLWADSTGSLPHAGAPRWAPVRTRPPAFVPSAYDRPTRLADVALSWNVLQHFYPYFDVIRTDLNAALSEALRSAASDSVAPEFLATLERLTAHLDDGHAGVSGPGAGSFFGPFSWWWVEGRLVITAVDHSAGSGLERGDVVLSVNREPTDRIYDASVAPRISAATEGWRRYRSLSMMAGGDRDSVALEIESADGNRRSVMVHRAKRAILQGAGRPEKIAQLRPGIWYVDVSRVDDTTFGAVTDTLARARGVIFDVRGYPYHLGTEPLAHLTDSTMTCAQWLVPIVSGPDHRNLAFDFSNWKVEPQAPRFRGKIAFLIDGRAISYAETWLGIVEHYRLGALVGEPTAGTNGNVNLIRLPGGYVVRFTGMKVLKHDGTRHHGVGIRPTVPVSPTLAGIRAGRDEQLEKAIAAVGG